MPKALPQTPRRNAPWTPLQRRTWLAEQRRKHHPLPAPMPVTLHSNLVSYWKLDEAEGSTRNDSYNVWDLSEWSFQEATGSGYVPVGQNNGILNFSADFGDGSGGKALVSFDSNSILAGDFTFSCWFNYNTSSGYDGQGLISLGGTVSIGIRAYDGAVNLVIYTNNGAGYSAVQTPNASVSENTWTHAVFVKSADTLRIYLNGAASAAGAFTGAITETPVGFFSGTDLIFGINPWGYPLIGTLDEVACWQRALSAAEISQLYNNGDGLAYEMF